MTCPTKDKPIIARPEPGQSCYNCNRFDAKGYEKTKIPCSKRKRIHKGIRICIHWIPKKVEEAHE